MTTDGFRKWAVAAARAAWDKKANEILVLDIRHQSDVADYMVIVGVDSSSQMKAVESAMEQALEDKGLRKLRREGAPRDRWMAIDYGGFVAHILLPEAREFYRLEQLWDGARHVSWEPKS